VADMPKEEKKPAGAGISTNGAGMFQRGRDRWDNLK